MRKKETEEEKNLKKIIGRNIEFFRTLHGWHKSDLAEKVGLDKLENVTYITNWESGRVKPVHYLEALASAFCCSVKDLENPNIEELREKYENPLFLMMLKSRADSDDLASIFTSERIEILNKLALPAAETIKKYLPQLKETMQDYLLNTPEALFYLLVDRLGLELADNVYQSGINEEMHEILNMEHEYLYNDVVEDLKIKIQRYNKRVAKIIKKGGK